MSRAGEGMTYHDANGDPLRPLSGRELDAMHKAMTESDVDPAFRMAWLVKETDLWLLTK